MVSDRWSTGNCTQILRIFFQVKVLSVHFSRSITITNKSISRTYTVASSLLGTSPLAVTTFLGLLDILMVSNSADLKVFLADHMHARSGNRGKVECSLVFFFEQVYAFGKIPSLASGTSFLSFRCLDIQAQGFSKALKDYVHRPTSL